MNTEPAPVEKPTPKKKKSLVSIPFIIIGLLLIAFIVPVVDLVPEEDPSVKKRDSLSEYLVYKVMTAQEGAKSKGTAIKGKSEGKMGEPAEAALGLGDDEGESGESKD